MKPETNDKISRFLLSFFCFTAYLFFCVAMVANALDTNLSDFLLG
jgi:hypothetical protein